MSLETILQAIRSAGQTQVDEIEAQAKAEVRAILDKASSEAGQIHEDACAAEVIPAFRERSRILQRARLEALRLQGDAREKLVEMALERARKRLESFRSDPAYAQVLKSLVQQALEEMDGSLNHGGAASLEADPRDQELLHEILSDPDQQQSIRYVLTCWGGVIARSSDGKVVVVNTLEARLEQAAPYIRRSLGAFFETSQPEEALHREPQPPRSS